MRVYCAVQILRQKRMYETQRETLYNQQFNMEQTRFTVESIQVCGLCCIISIPVCYDASTLAACNAVASSITHAFCHCRT